MSVADDGRNVWTETIGKSDYIRFAPGAHTKLAGKRITGGETEGRIRAITNAAGEHHPAIIHVEGGEDIAAHQLPYCEIDGRHRGIPLADEIYNAIRN
jgi:hypothetical protein